MGLMDKAKDAAQQQLNGGRAAAAQPAPGWTPAAAPAGGCTGSHYVTDVNKGSINMGRWQSNLNDMYAKGYRLAHVLEQDGNTVQVFEHHFH